MKYAVCPTCEGEGKHVNPSIDAHGISAEEMDALGDDFRDDYFGGAYDVVCNECGGRRVVEACSEEMCEEPTVSIPRDGTDRRDRVSLQHYAHCFEHLTDEEREAYEDRSMMLAEMAAERRMGA